MGKYEDLFKANEELAELVEDIWKTRALALKTQAQIINVFFIVKACKTLRAILHLCRLGYGEDAGILLRSLFELAVNSIYIGDNDELAQKYMDFEAVYLDGLTRGAAPNYMNEIFSADKLAEIAEAAEKARRKHQYKSKHSWSSMGMKKMAIEADLGKDYAYFYPLVSELVHSTMGSSRHYIKIDPDSRLVSVMLSPSNNLMPQVLLTSGFLMVGIAGQWNSQFELGIENQTKDIINRLMELKEEHVPTGAEQDKLS